MRTAAICPTCATYINAVCVIYDGQGLTNINVAPLDNLEDILQNINDNLVPVHGSGAPDNGAVYEGQLYIDDVTGEVYIATTTGGGAGDWEQLALQSALPPTPPLDDVLLAGNDSTHNIIIKDLLVSPVQSTTVQPIGIFINDQGLPLTNEYAVDHIYIENPISGDTLLINLDNLQNQAIDFPSSSGTLALQSYKVYTALLTQSGSNPPTAIELENTLGAITFGYQSSGVYTVNSSGLFTAHKTWTNPTLKDNVNLQLSMYRNTSSQLFIIDADGDDGLLETSIEIRVYP